MNVIVTTTIRPPTEALVKFAGRPGWRLIVVGDLKTPHSRYEQRNDLTYLHPDYQERHYKELSDLIGWNCIERRNIGFVEAFRMGAEIVASVDDDNIPYDAWGTDLLIGKTINATCWESSLAAFDPLWVTNVKHLWHRGFPIQLVQQRKYESSGLISMTPLVQADLWDGDPDIDAIARMLFRPDVRFDPIEPYCSRAISPFNSQNTFLHRSVLPSYFVFPHIGRMDDIWGAYIAQHLLAAASPMVVYARASVIQVRNEHDLTRDFQDEVIGYLHSEKLLANLKEWRSFLPERALKAFDCYQALLS